MLINKYHIPFGAVAFTLDLSPDAEFLHVAILNNRYSQTITLWFQVEAAMAMPLLTRRFVLLEDGVEYGEKPYYLYLGSFFHVEDDQMLHIYENLEFVPSLKNTNLMTPVDDGKY